jgi:hypothetical protein
MVVLHQPFEHWPSSLGLTSASHGSRVHVPGSPDDSRTVGRG